MGGDRIEGAVTALLALVDRLEPTDNFGLVTFNTAVNPTVPAGPLTNKAAVKEAIASVYAAGGTDLSAGYLRGVQEARRVVGEAGGTLLLISDGHANVGVVDPEACAPPDRQVVRPRVSWSSTPPCRPRRGAIRETPGLVGLAGGRVPRSADLRGRRTAHHCRTLRGVLG